MTQNLYESINIITKKRLNYEIEIHFMFAPFAVLPRW
jgi:hypothetical protein